MYNDTDLSGPDPGKRGGAYHRRAATGWLGLPSAAILAASLAAIWAAAPLVAQPTISQDRGLRIASWNLQDAVTAGAIERAEPKERRWRNTFGAERRIEEDTTFDGRKLKSDVVLLQGVRSIREVRKMFPARDWKLILSRQILQAGDGRINRDSSVGGDVLSTTAVAVRYQRFLRVTAVDHLLDLSGEATEAGKKRTPAGLAVRLVNDGQVFWAVSAVLPSGCSGGAGGCEERDKLAEWLEAQRAAGFAVVLGGRLDEALAPTGAARGTCTSQGILADPGLKAEAGADAIAGCVAFVDMNAG